MSEKQYRRPPVDRPWRLVLAISQMVRNDLERHHGLRPTETRLVYNGVDTSRFSPALQERERDRTRRQLGVGDDEVLCLIVAHNLELKGVPALLRAVTLLRAAGHKIVLAVVGGRRIAGYVRKSSQLGIERQVRFLGAVEDPAPFYAAADVYAQPTWYDPCSLVVLEALACGLPVVTSRFNGAGELIEQGRTGSVVQDPGNMIELAAALAQWLPLEKRSQAAVAARRTMLANTFDRNVDAMLAIYQEIIAARGRRRGHAA